MASPEPNAGGLPPADFNAAEWFVDRNVREGRGQRPALHVGDRILAYDDLLELTNRTGNALRDLGVGRGDRVAIIALDAPEFLAAFWGALKIGAVAVPLNTYLRSAEYRYPLDDCGARVAIVSAELLEKCAGALAANHAVERVLVAGADGKGGGDVRSFDSLEALTAGASSRIEAARTGRDDPAFWLYTSGSTGEPKAAVHRHASLFVCQETYARHVLGLTPADRVYSAAKLFFAYGLGNTGYFPLGVGASSVLDPGRATAERSFAAIERHRPTVYFAVPTLFARMLAAREAGCRHDLSSLRLCVSAGEALPASIYERWREAFQVELLDGIGTTEMLHIFISNRSGAARPGSAGTPVPGYQARLVDDVGRPVARGEVGNLLVAGGSTMARYWGQEAKTREVLEDGWLRTGDKLHQDADGFYWHVGRSDDMLKVGGLWVSPVEVEAAILEHPAVLEAAVVGREDGDGLTRPRAFVVLKEGLPEGADLPGEILGFVRGRLASYKCPEAIELLAELPKTATGKLQRFRLRG